MMSLVIFYFNLVILALFVIMYFYQAVYLFIGLFSRPKIVNPNPKLHKYLCIIPAKNEGSVIGNLIDSIEKQDYTGQVDIIVIADNCTDNTYDVAKSMGAFAIKRCDTSHIGKGYALDFLFKYLKENNLDSNYEGYFVFDADNLLSHDYISKMNMAFDLGYKVITSYRNSKNFGDNWLSMSYGLFFLREAIFVNAPRMKLGLSSAISGTGFLISKEVIDQMGGWNCTLLAEDLQFNTEYIMQGGSIAYQNDAVFYDEQPTKFTQSWRQRMRWSKGYSQVLHKNALKLGKKLFSKFNFNLFDSFMSVAPALFISITTVAFDLVALIVSLCMRDIHAVYTLLLILGIVLGFYIGLFFIIGVLLVIREWNNIKIPWYKKIFATLVYPIFMLSFVPISIASAFCRVVWHPIEHTSDVNINDIESLETKKK